MHKHSPNNDMQKERVRGYCCKGHSGSKRQRTRWAKQKLRNIFRRELRRGEHDA